MNKQLKQSKGRPRKLDLKAERVQEDLTAKTSAVDQKAASRLKAERVQLALKGLPGWALTADGRAIDRLRQLASPQGAADYAGFIFREAARRRQRVEVVMSGHRILVTIHAPAHTNGLGISRKQLSFAALLR